MKNSTNVFIFLVVGMVVIIGAVAYANSRSEGPLRAQARMGGSHDARSNFEDMSGHHVNQPAVAAEMKDLVGKVAPDFALVDKEGTTHRLSELRGKTVVLFFNEGLMCYPSCWSQMVQISSDPRLNSDDIRSYSVVVDSVSNWDLAIAKMPKLKETRVLFDTSKTVSASYGMLNAPSSMHRGAYPGHTYVVIDREGVVRFVYDDPRMGINNALIAEKAGEIR